MTASIHLSGVLQGSYRDLVGSDADYRSILFVSLYNLIISSVGNLVEGQKQARTVGLPWSGNMTQSSAEKGVKQPGIQTASNTQGKQAEEEFSVQVDVGYEALDGGNSLFEHGSKQEFR